LYRFVIFCSSKSSKQLEVHVLTRFYITLFTIFFRIKNMYKDEFYMWRFKAGVLNFATICYKN
jgi:hypothetical protein